MGRKIRDLQIGERFDRLSIVADGERDIRNQKRYWAVCECGEARRLYIASKLLSGHTRSCGCLHRDVASKIMTKHGMTGSPEFTAWAKMKQRCENPGNKKYHLYGGKGVVVCERWRGNFGAFYADMGQRPSARHSIDRYPDNNGNYELSNCRWATPQQQAQNLRTNALVELYGETICISEAARRLDIPRSTLKNYISRNGMTHQQIVDRASKGEFCAI